MCSGEQCQSTAENKSEKECKRCGCVAINVDADIDPRYASTKETRTEEPAQGRTAFYRLTFEGRVKQSDAEKRCNLKIEGRKCQCENEPCYEAANCAL